MVKEFISVGGAGSFLRAVQGPPWTDWPRSCVRGEFRPEPLRAGWLETWQTGVGSEVRRAGNEFPMDFKHSLNRVLVSSIDLQS